MGLVLRMVQIMMLERAFRYELKSWVPASERRKRSQNGGKKACRLEGRGLVANEIDHGLISGI